MYQLAKTVYNINNMDFKITAILYPEWKPIDKPIHINDVCTIIPSERKFLCSYKIPYEQFEYLFFGSLDSEDILFAIQTGTNDQYYARVLDKKAEKIFALRLYKKARQNET